ncbi:MAG: NUDIX hydrolase [candidate division Zixibacteria bacterium]|nr:NUDIX hydrolase [Candidatus Tariuqbacter arcticus]
MEQFTEGCIRKVCTECGTVNYQNPIPSVAAVITDDEGKLLLTKRSVEPQKGMWCLPGGFIEMNESPVETLVREVFEETGLKVIPGELIDACSKIGGYHGDVIILGYTAEIIGGELSPGDDAEEAEFISLDKLPQIAFRSHTYFIEKIFSK